MIADVDILFKDEILGERKVDTAFGKKITINLLASEWQDYEEAKGE